MEAKEARVLAKKDNPLISIGITCFNARDTIADAIEGALRQDWDNLEIIVVDDASADGSADAISKKSGEDGRIRLVRHSVNRGYPAALNSIIREARGEFIAIFDDDDISAPARLREQYERILGYERTCSAKPVLCYSNRAIFLPGADKPSDTAYAIGRKAPEPHGPAVADHILWKRGDRRHCWGMFGSCTLMARRRTFEEIGLFDEDFRRCAEWDFAVRAAFAGAHFIAVNQSLVAQRKTITADKAGKIPQNYQIRLCRKYRDYLKKNGVYLAALVLARAGKKRDVWRYRLMTAVACFLSPHRVLASRLETLFGAPKCPQSYKG